MLSLGKKTKKHTHTQKKKNKQQQNKQKQQQHIIVALNDQQIGPTSLALLSA